MPPPLRAISRGGVSHLLGLIRAWLFSFYQHNFDKWGVRLASMTKSELIEVISRQQNLLAFRDVELAVKCILEQMSQALSSGDRIEIRGFGSFSLHYRPPRLGRNPKTGETVALAGKYVPHFKPGKELRDRVDHEEAVDHSGFEEEESEGD